MIKIYKIIFLFLLCSILILNQLYAQVRLPKLISDGMVFQRDLDVNIWGWASPDESVSVNFQDKDFHTTTDQSGKWLIKLGYLKAGGPYEMIIKGITTIHLKDILVGDVWICSGQSNMELPMYRVRPLYEQEISDANDPFIRYFYVPQKYDFNTPHEDFEKGIWQTTTPQSVLNFSAVAYFFAKDLYEKYKIPVGLIHSALGGSPAESWLSEESLKTFPDHYREALRFRNPELIKEIETEDQKRGNAWYGELNSRDLGHMEHIKWYNPQYNSTDWKKMNIPGYWAEEEGRVVNGVVWFRKEFHLTGADIEKPAKLNLGRIVDADSVFINGKFIGRTTYQYPPRWYNVVPDVLKEGKNTITLRIINVGGKGGFVPDKPYELVLGSKTVDLKGHWQYKIGAEMEPLQSQTFIRWKPLGLYNAMIVSVI
jgi:sialate O-acetylesterase